MKTQIILLIATVIFVTSCGNPHCERGEGRTVKLSGKSDCSVFVVDHLRVKISGVGKVYYKGNPEIEQEISGVGKVISKN